jgi:hypothetical protein
MKCQEAIFEVTGQFAQSALRGSRIQLHRSPRRLLFDASRRAGSVRQSKKTRQPPELGIHRGETISPPYKPERQTAVHPSCTKHTVTSSNLREASGLVSDCINLDSSIDMGANSIPAQPSDFLGSCRFRRCKAQPYRSCCTTTGDRIEDGGQS